MAQRKQGHKAGRSPTQAKRSVTFSASDHPRHPAGTSGGRGGEFMPKEAVGRGRTWPADPARAEAVLKAAKAAPAKMSMHYWILVKEGQMTESEALAAYRKDRNAGKAVYWK